MKHLNARFIIDIDGSTTAEVPTADAGMAVTEEDPANTACLGNPSLRVLGAMSQQQHWPLTKPHRFHSILPHLYKLVFVHRFTLPVHTLLHLFVFCLHWFILSPSAVYVRCH